MNKLEWERRKLAAVIFACIGVIAIVYGGVTSSDSQIPASIKEPSHNLRKSTFLGNFLALLASIWYGLFQVIYKKTVALSNDPELIDEGPVLSHDSSSTIISENVDGDLARECSGSTLPFGLHPNFFVSVVGFMTAILMPCLFPIFHYLDVEKFALPPNLKTTVCLSSIALMGLIFNSGFMVLLSSDTQYIC